MYPKELEEYVSVGLCEGLLDVKVKFSCWGRLPKKRHQCDGVFSLSLVIVFLHLRARSSLKLNPYFANVTGNNDL